MGTIYQYIQLKKIEFQTNYNEVLISCEIKKNMEIIQYHYIISYTELNKIFGELQCQNEHLNLYESLEKIKLNDEENLYSLDFEKNKIKNSWIPFLSEIRNSKQIRA